MLTISFSSRISLVSKRDIRYVENLTMHLRTLPADAPVAMSARSMKSTLRTLQSRLSKSSPLALKDADLAKKYQRRTMSTNISSSVVVM